ncbi:MAG: hypothetical protein HOO93_14060 [Methyloglobulus sp.]|nr:hypothetical protein [Methyloglobulus sp.]
MKTKILTALNNANDAPRASAHPTFGASYGLGSLPFPPVPYFGSQPSTFVKKILDQ